LVFYFTLFVDSDLVTCLVPLLFGGTFVHLALLLERYSLLLLLLRCCGSHCYAITIHLIVDCCYCYSILFLLFLFLLLRWTTLIDCYRLFTVILFVDCSRSVARLLDPLRDVDYVVDYIILLI